MKNLVIVESPAKAKTIEKFLGKDYKVMSSYGHIRDLKKKEFSIDVDTFTPNYEIPEDKYKIVESLKEEAKKADTVWLASDEDREGEAISWPLYEVLGLTPEKTKRIVFHEITKPAILKAIENPREIDINLVKAQQARRVLDRIVGFKLSPVLWRKVKPQLSAGRVQSVAVRLIVEREREIKNYKVESAFRVVAVFLVPDGNRTVEMKAELSTRFKTQKEAEDFLKECEAAEYTVSDIVTKPLKKYPAAPFTTSTLQQEAARKLGFSVSQTMSVAQKLYESGLITYMRTDSVNLSALCINACKQVISEKMGEKYLHSRQFTTKIKGAQEAHEAIRPTYMENNAIDGNSQEKRLYDLIWKRTLASQMAEAEMEKTTVTIKISNRAETFVANGEVLVFDGFLKVYRESSDEDASEDESTSLLPPLSKGEDLKRKEIVAMERFTQHPPRYTEASLVHKMEELGIGRPSTYAPTISTIQQREYVEKADQQGTPRDYAVLTLNEKGITSETKQENTGYEKAKLVPTDIGTVVNDFLSEHFTSILDYNFTANVEKDFDEVAEGSIEWTDLMRRFYGDFEPMVEKASHLQSEHKVGEHELGIDPASGKPVFVKIGRFGPVVQIGTAEDEEKPRFAQMKPGQRMDTITLEEALDLFKLPRILGEFEGKTVKVGTGRFGPYVYHNGVYVSVPKDFNPMTLALHTAIDLIEAKRKAEAEKHIKSFDEEPKLEILNGRFGPYIAYDGTNYRLPKTVEKPAELTLEQCMEIIKAQPASGAKKTRTTARKTTTRKTAAKK